MSDKVDRYPNDVKDWWRKTQDDIKWARYDFSGGFYTQVCFISQQIAEKALKTHLLSKNQIVHKIHKLPVLLKQCAKIDASFSELLNHAKKLDRYYISTRYLSGFGPHDGYSQKEAEETLVLAKEVVDFVKKRISLGK